MENKSFLEKLKFGIGDGNLQYYLYNWKCPDMTPEQIGLVLQWVAWHIKFYSEQRGIAGYKIFPPLFNVSF
jgi:hypothetical protein